MPASDEEIARDTEGDWIAFSGLDRMKSHWDRPGWLPGRSAYYWYLTFSGESELQEIAATCQAELTAPYFDLVLLDDLHMTLERIAFDDEINEAALAQVAAAAADMCRTIPIFSICVGPLAGSSGAISFSASPYSTIAELRSTLDTATRSVLGTAMSPPDSTHFRPHIGIAYCNEPYLQSRSLARFRASVSCRSSK